MPTIPTAAKIIMGGILFYGIAYLFIGYVVARFYFRSNRADRPKPAKPAKPEPAQKQPQMRVVKRPINNSSVN